MKFTSLRAALCGLALVAAPSAFAWGSTVSIPLFQSRMTTARGSGSPSGTTVTRAEIKTALEAFLSSDDGKMDAAEHSYLGTQVASPTFLAGIAVDAKDYLNRFHEVNDAVIYESDLQLGPVGQTPAQVFGATGALSNNSWIQAGSIPWDDGVANQVTLQWAYYNAYFETSSTFTPLSLAELQAKLATKVFGVTPSAAEVNGAVAWLSANAGTGARYYTAGWSDPYGRFYPGGIGGYIVVSVSHPYRDSARYIEVMTWSE